MQLLNMAVADLTAGPMAFPDQLGIVGLCVAPLGVDKGRVPASAIGTGDMHAALKQIERGLAPHADAGRHVIVVTDAASGARIH